jgi:hypothetical protein
MGDSDVTHISSKGVTVMAKDFTQNSCREFVAVLASSAPVPGGGGAAALVGAAGTALGHMASNLTVGKKKYAEIQEQILQLNGKFATLEEELLDQGITPGTIRLSIGTEHIDDIIADLEKGFAAAQ